MKNVFRLGWLGLILFGCFLFFQQLRDSEYFPIKRVRIYGANRVVEFEVQHALEPLLNRGFFGIRVEQIRDRLLQQPWAADVLVRRYWPDRVEITIVERQAVAKWNGKTLLSSEGDLFSPKPDTVPVHLPLFVGPEGKQVLMLSYFNEMNRILTPLHAKISYLEMTPFLVWKIRLDNGMMMHVGYKDILTRLEHFVKVYPKIVGSRANDVEYIDLRYSNGMAIRWRQPVNT